MHRLKIGIAMACAMVTNACSTTERVASAGDLTGLIGAWQTDRLALSGSGYYQTTLTFGSTGATTNETRMYGAYAGQQRDDVSSYSRLSGTYNVTRDSLEILATSLATWDRFYGANSPEQVVDLRSIAGRNSAAAFRVSGDALVLSYMTYPADAPVATKETFHRVR